MNTMACVRLVAFGVVFSAAAMACASSEATDPAGHASAALEDTDALLGTWDFVLAGSDVAAPIRERCAKTTADAAKAKACFDDVAIRAAAEKIRFTKAPNGEITWTSFGNDGDKEIVFLEAKVTLTRLDGGAVQAKVVSTPTGTMAAKPMKHEGMRIERASDGTIVIVDTAKGRLAYRRAS